MAHKTTLFLCRCGTNVADFIDLDALRTWARETGSVDEVTIHDFLCAPAGKQFIEDTLRENGSSRAVMAACSPKLQLKTFEECADHVGLNQTRVSMANIREQCAWVTPDKEQATLKARSLIQAALNRSQLHEDLPRQRMEINADFVVIGGGIAGIEAALQAAEAGRKVVIFEKETSLGGELIKVEELAPTSECAPCLLAPRLSEIRENPDITVVTNATVTDVLGFFGNFTVIARKKARFITDDCIGCEACFEPCPVDMSSPFHLGLGTHKAVYALFPGSVPAAAAIDPDHCLHFKGEDCQACVDNCPFGAVDFSQLDETVEVKSGAVIVAIGAEVHVPKDIPRLALDGVTNVYTYAEFERLTCSNGPTQAELRTRDGSQPNEVAVLHCAGSLCSDGLSYCSGVCCTNALMAGETIRKQIPEAIVHNIHDRLVFPGSETEGFLRRQIQEGTRMIECRDLDRIRLEGLPSGKVAIHFPDREDLVVDMAILSTGFVPGEKAREFSRLLNTELDPHGFLKSDHAILNATGSTIDGISLAGSCLQPSHATRSVTTAQAAVGRSLSRLVPGRTIELETMVSYIDPDHCAGCRMCASTCPYKAIAFDRTAKRSVVNEAICRGCGTCAATCPSNAITARHFTNDQLIAEVKGVLHG
ncbi:MAG: CoB--CoM heterodisulfide reductase iron-sulfur subunit A family protein [Fibrobacteria bacterium]|nr:CoB--CoM heterodisulfide reductase iron-sulfur subunit A family protein [Fibrobacteria bacterium]